MPHPSSKLLELYEDCNFCGSCDLWNATSPSNPLHSCEFRLTDFLTLSSSCCLPCLLYCMVLIAASFRDTNNPYTVVFFPALACPNALPHCHTAGIHERRQQRGQHVHNIWITPAVRDLFESHKNGDWPNTSTVTNQYTRITNNVIKAPRDTWRL
jgi:hypothetical protein